MKCKAPISPCSCLQKKIPSISDIRKNFLLSSALGRKQTCSLTQPVKGSLKHCGQGPPQTLSGAANGAVSLSPPLHTCRPSPHAQGFAAHTKIWLFYWDSPGSGWSHQHWCGSSRTRALEGQTAEPREPLSPLAAPAHQPSATQCRPFHSIPVSQSPRES